jgi:hypothetical protein
MGKYATSVQDTEKRSRGRSFLDTLHHIRVPTDIRIDPAVPNAVKRHEEKVSELLRRFYGDGRSNPGADPLVAGTPG